MGLVQEAIDDACALLLLGPSFSRFLQLSEKLVVDFPAHGILHMEPGHDNVARQTTLEKPTCPIVELFHGFGIARSGNEGRADHCRLR
jgi:hypothetical protein